MKAMFLCSSSGEDVWLPCVERMRSAEKTVAPLVSCSCQGEPVDGLALQWHGTHGQVQIWVEADEGAHRGLRPSAPVAGSCSQGAGERHQPIGRRAPGISWCHMETQQIQDLLIASAG